MRYGEDQSYIKPLLDETSETTLLVGGHFKYRFKVGQGWSGNEKEPNNIGSRETFIVDRDHSGGVNYDEMRHWRLNIKDAALKDAYQFYIFDKVIEDITLDYGQENGFIWLLGEESNTHFGTGGESNKKNWYIHPDLLQLYADEVMAATNDSALTLRYGQMLWI